MKKTKKESKSLETSEAARAAGWRRIARRQHPQPGQMTLRDCKVKITINLDADVLEFFKARAAMPDAAPYQTQINNELRRVIERQSQSSETSIDYSALVNDKNFIEAVARRLAQAGN